MERLDFLGLGGGDLITNQQVRGSDRLGRTADQLLSPPSIPLFIAGRAWVASD